MKKKANETTCIAQGDILFVPVSAIADGQFKLESEQISITEARKSENGRLIVGHSETGHHHYVDPTTNGAMLFATNQQFVTVLKAPTPVTVKHDRGWDTHNDVVLPAGDWAVIKQRERRPNAWIAARD